MVVCWRYAEARAFEPFEDEPLPEGKEPNELRIGLFQATGLAVKDKALLWGEGSSDPRISFSVDGTALKCTSETVKKSLDPVWKQVMTLELPKGPAGGLKLQGKCEDVDEVSGADFMGQFEVDLTECLDGQVKRLWRSLEQGNYQCAIKFRWIISRCTRITGSFAHRRLEGRRLGRRRASLAVAI